MTVVVQPACGSLQPHKAHNGFALTYPPEPWCAGYPPARPGWDEYFLEIAKTVALRADCSRRKVGAIIVRPDRTIVATGYNGSPSGGPSCLAGECPRGRMSKTEVVPGSSYDSGAGSCVALHAEQNALLRASWDEMQDSTLYCTDEPCVGCARMIAGTPIARVVWPEGESS